MFSKVISHKIANRRIFGPDKEDPMDPGMEVFRQLVVRRDTGGGGAEQLGVPRNYDTTLLLVPQIDPSVPQPVVQSRRRPLLGPSPG